MDRCKFPDGVPITGGDLEFESDSRQDDAKRILRDGFQVGVLEGFSVSVAPDNLSVLVAPGGGYVGDVDVGNKIDSVFGSFVQRSSSDTLAPSGGLWDTSKIYYVCAVYKESATISRPNVDGTSLEEVRVVSSSIDCGLELITYDDYSALSDVDKHKRLKLARIKPTVSNQLSSSNIELPFQVKRIKSAEGPSSLSGVSVIEVGSYCGDGISSIEWDADDKKLRWKDALDDNYGSWVSITGNGIYTLSSENSSKWIKINVVYSLLSLVDVVDSIKIYDLYEGDIRPCSGADRLLRSMGGSGLKTRNNPLGLTLNDLGGGEEDFPVHRQMMHNNGIVGSSDSLYGTIVHSDTTEDYIVFGLLSGDSKFYVRGKEYSAVQDSERPYGSNVSTIQFDDYSGQHFAFFEVYIDEFGVIKRNRRAEVSDKVYPDVEGVVILDFYTTGESFTLDYVASTKTLSFNGGDGVVLISGHSGIYNLFGSNGIDWIRVYVDFDRLSTGDESDSWSVLADSISRSACLPLCNVCYFNGDIYGVGCNFNVGGGNIYDMRLFGTTCAENIRTDVLKELGLDIVSNGVLWGLDYSVNGSVFTLNTGRAVIKGKVVVVDDEIDLSMSGKSAGYYIVLLKDNLTLEVVSESISSFVLDSLDKDYVKIAKIYFNGSIISSTDLVDLRNSPGYKFNSDIDIPTNLSFSNLKSFLVDNNYFVWYENKNLYVMYNARYDFSSGNWGLISSAYPAFGIRFDYDKFYALKDLDNISLDDFIVPVYIPSGSNPGPNIIVSKTNGYRIRHIPFNQWLYGSDPTDRTLSGLLASPIITGRDITISSDVTVNAPYFIFICFGTLYINAKIDLKGHGGRGASAQGQGDGADGFIDNYGYTTFTTWNGGAWNAIHPMSGWFSGGGGGGGGYLLDCAGGAGHSAGFDAGQGGAGAGDENGHPGKGLSNSYIWGKSYFDFDIEYPDRNKHIIFMNYFNNGGILGWGGGGGGSGGVGSGTSGAGGNGGGAVYIEARNVVFGANGIIDCRGNNGNNGSNERGGGGGGGGGVIFIVTDSCKVGSSIYTATQLIENNICLVSGGDGGSGGNGGDGGDGGSGGLILKDFSRL